MNIHSEYKGHYRDLPDYKERVQFLRELIAAKNNAAPNWELQPLKEEPCNSNLLNSR